MLHVLFVLSTLLMLLPLSAVWTCVALVDTSMPLSWLAPHLIDLCASHSFQQAYFSVNVGAIIVAFGGLAMEGFHQWKYRKLTYRHYRDDL